ncbi:MAG: VWA domain-containing protein, partial [Thermoanaerobaculia bacterium]|nr:VWA domain-containing protein [Thermoanaerobaculia bacterium]
DGSLERFTLLAFMPPETPSQRISVSRELVVIIDTSGSMGGEPLRQAKEAVILALERLNPADRFHLIEFNSVTRTFESGPVWADGSAVERAKQWVEDLESQGGTNMLPALELVLGSQETPATMLRQVIFVTDGMVSNERELAGYVRRNIGESRLFTVGIGSAPNGHLMRSLARQGRGTVTHIDGIDRVTESMTELFAMIEHPALTDLAIDHPDPTAEIYPTSITDLYAGEPVLVTVRHVQSATGVRIKGRRGARAYTRDLQPTVRPVTTSGIEKLWARQKIEALEEEMLDRQDPELIRPRIVETALRHGLVSTYTSLVAVDRSSAGYDGCEPVPIPLDVPAGMDHVVGQRLPGTATPFQWLLVIGLALIAAAATWDVLSAEVLRRRIVARAKSNESGGVR